MHRRPQVYQFLLLSRVTDVKYGCLPLPLMRACTGKILSYITMLTGGPLCFDGGGGVENFKINCLRRLKTLK